MLAYKIYKITLHGRCALHCVNGQIPDAGECRLDMIKDYENHTTATTYMQVSSLVTIAQWIMPKSPVQHLLTETNNSRTTF